MIIFLVKIVIAQEIEYKELRKKLRSYDLAVRLQAVEVIEKLDSLRAIKLWSEALEDINWEVRYAAVVALEKQKGKIAFRLLFNVLNDSSISVVAGAARALAKNQDPEIIDQLKLLMKKKDYVLRNNAIAVLGLMKYPGAVESLIDALRD